jgi:hypothetical protein
MYDVPDRPSDDRQLDEERRPITILVVGSDDGAIEHAAEALEADGQRVLRCHKEGEPAFPCNAFVEGSVCPLDAGFDLVLMARRHATEILAPTEFGAVCALRAAKPVVVMGEPAGNPLEPWTSGTIGETDSISGQVADPETMTTTRSAWHQIDLRQW